MGLDIEKDKFGEEVKIVANSLRVALETAIQLAIK